jgi:KDO2-lipid IV(A) lauroyltransferase
MRRTVRRLKRATKRAANSAIGAVTIGLLKLLRQTNPDTMRNIAGRFMRTVGPLLPENRIGRANLTAAFPEKSPTEIDTILRGVWDNLGRIAVEFAHLDRLSDFDPWHPERAKRIEVHPSDRDRLLKILEQRRPAIAFAAHFGNWELPAVCAAACKVDTAVLYRRPNNPALDRGTHVGMLVDQYYSRGVDVAFFGRRTKANPLLARLARHFDCPIYGLRVVRLPGHRFRPELTEQIQPVRDAEGKVDIAGTTQAVMSVIEGWIREYPEQWLWLHRRWRPEDQASVNDRS